MKFMDKNDIRTLFSRSMSKMYQTEVPQYGTLLDIVSDVNQHYLKEHPDLRTSLEKLNELNRISEERHGAIRLGTGDELFTIRRLFAVMGMYPVNYYDLSIANIPVHSTAFRPIDDNDLKQNPFRVFASLLRVELIPDENIRKIAEEILSHRDIFTKRVRELIDIYEAEGGLTEEQGKEFVTEALETFRWHEIATVDESIYKKLRKIHPLAADVVCFRGPHINHLTPRTLDISQVQSLMPKHRLNPKAVIEGPPERHIPVLLRQTSFKALEEAISFPKHNGDFEKGSHQARFGEIEQRGAALTEKGKQLYEQLLEDVREKITPDLDGRNADQYNETLKKVFSQFPDDLSTMRTQGLVYLEYYFTEKGSTNKDKFQGLNLEELIKQGYVDYSPITYEDFLPVSAAGIFTSNLGDAESQVLTASSNQALFEQQLGTEVIDSFELYRAKEEASLQKVLSPNT